MPPNSLRMELTDVTANPQLAEINAYLLREKLHSRLFSVFAEIGFKAGMAIEKFIASGYQHETSRQLMDAWASEMDIGEITLDPENLKTLWQDMVVNHLVARACELSGAELSILYLLINCLEESFAAEMAAYFQTHYKLELYTIPLQMPGYDIEDAYLRVYYTAAAD